VKIRVNLWLFQTAKIIQTVFIDNLPFGGYTLCYFIEVAFINPVNAILATQFKNIKEISLFRPESSTPAPAASLSLRLP
jgi:hypothetical protein